MTQKKEKWKMKCLEERKARKELEQEKRDIKTDPI